MIKLSEYLNEHHLARFRRALADASDAETAALCCRPDDGGTGGAHLSTIEDRCRVRGEGVAFERVRESFKL